MTDETDGSVVRSEEQLRVTTERARTSKVTIRKRIVTATINVPVQIRREVVEIVEDEIDDAVRSGEVADHPDGPVTPWIVLSEERPVVSLQVVAFERVRLVRSTHRGDQDVTADVRHEQVQVETTPTTAEAASASTPSVGPSEPKSMFGYGQPRG